MNKYLKMNKVILILLLVVSSVLGSEVSAQNDVVDYLSPKKYTLAGIVVDGVRNFDHTQIINKTGLVRGEEVTIPGDDIAKAINNLWKEKLFSDVQIVAEKIQGNNVFLVIKLKERERLSRYSFKGVSKSEANKIREVLDLYTGKIITEDLLFRVKQTSRNYFIDKGYLKTKVNVVSQPDTLINNSARLTIKVKKGEKIKISKILIEGNQKLSDGKLRRAMKKTKQKRWYFFNIGSKFMQSSFANDKKHVIEKYKELAFRDAEITFDTLYDVDERSINIKMTIDEGNKYFIRNVDWIGNLKYSSGRLDTILGIKPGDEYNQATLETRLFMNPGGSDVSSLYMDDGYLFFQLTPVETQVTSDSVDLELRIYEGKQARNRNITIVGNTKTSDHVILREIYTKPGDLFSRDAVIRTQRQLAQNGYFDPEKLAVNPKPNPADGTVDIEYVVEEKPSDQIELSGGWGAGRIVGTLGVVFNNFSSKKFFRASEWKPLPSGDGQRLSIRAQSNGYFYQSYNASFTEPWLGGKKPNSLTVSIFHSVQASDPVNYRDSTDLAGKKVKNPNRRYIKITGASIGLGKRLKWPDDYFLLQLMAGYQYYDLNNYGNVFSFSDGYANNLSFQATLSRNSIDQPLYPRTGSSFTLSAKMTPMYSWFDGVDDYSDLSDQERYKWLEYNKIKFTSSWFTPLSRDKKLVINARLGFGFLNAWNSEKGAPPFERFFMGGSGLTGFSLDGREIIALRGYDDGHISPQVNGGRIISKYTMELRYPLSLNPSATIYMLGFIEAGNTWNDYKKYNPFKVKRSAGVGVRIFLPMFGLMGLDYGWGLDEVDAGAAGEYIHNSEIQLKGYRGQFHFTIGMNLGEL